VSVGLAGRGVTGAQPPSGFRGLRDAESAVRGLGGRGSRSDDRIAIPPLLPIIPSLINSSQGLIERLPLVFQCPAAFLTSPLVAVFAPVTAGRGRARHTPPARRITPVCHLTVATAKIASPSIPRVRLPLPRSPAVLPRRLALPAARIRFLQLRERGARSSPVTAPLTLVVERVFRAIELSSCRHPYSLICSS